MSCGILELESTIIYMRKILIVDFYLSAKHYRRLSKSFDIQMQTLYKMPLL